MQGLQPHTHADRQTIIAAMIPLIQQKFGDNLVALAVTASFARGDDAAYSDLELTAFVKTMPEGKRWDGVGKIHNGMLVELVWMTRDVYLETIRDITPNWYLAGSDTLVPLINQPFIDELNQYQIENRREKCLAQAKHRWHEVQEATGKVLTAIDQTNRDGVPLLLGDMALHMLITLAFLNETPYITFARFITQAREFALKPADFDRLLDILVQGMYQDLSALRTVVVAVFSQFEAIFASLDIELYNHDLLL